MRCVDERFKTSWVHTWEKEIHLHSTRATLGFWDVVLYILLRKKMSPR